MPTKKWVLGQTGPKSPIPKGTHITINSSNTSQVTPQPRRTPAWLISTATWAFLQATQEIRLVSMSVFDALVAGLPPASGEPKSLPNAGLASNGRNPVSPCAFRILLLLVLSKAFDVFGLTTSFGTMSTLASAP